MTIMSFSISLIFILLGLAIVFASIQLDSKKFFLPPWLVAKLLQWQQLLEQQDLIGKIGYLMLFVLLLVVLFLLIWVFGFLGLVAIILGFLFIPAWWVKHQHKRRLERFDEQLPSALETIANSLRAGQSFTQAIVPVATKFPQPMAQVFSIAMQQMKLGTPTADALKYAGEAYPTREWWLFVEAVEALLSLGGNLAEMVHKCAQTARRRQQIEQRLNTLTAQGRFQGWIMGGLPIFMLLVLKALEPGLYQQLVGTVLGWFILAIAAVLEIVAIWLFKKILAIEV